MVLKAGIRLVLSISRLVLGVVQVYVMEFSAGAELEHEVENGEYPLCVISVLQ